MQFIPQLSCIVVLIAAVVTLTVISQVESTVNEHDVEYENAVGYRMAASCLVCAASAAIPYHISMIIVRYLYLCSRMEKKFKLYLYIVRY